MSKSIVVINTPKKCLECPFCNSSDECILQNEDANIAAADSWDDLMFGCPLKTLPKKISMKKPGEYEYGKMHGWNQCIDEIVGKS